MNAKLSNMQKKFAVQSIRLMCKHKELKDVPARLRNFIRINYGVEYSLDTCRKMLKRHGY